MQPPPEPPPAVVLPAEVPAAAWRIVVLKATAPGKQIRWLNPSADADLVPFPDGKTAVFAATKPGRYAVFAWTAAGDVPGEAAKCVIVVAGDVAPPADKFERDLLAAYATETAADKAQAAKLLAAAYREAEQAATGGVGATAGDLAGRLKQSVEAKLPATALTAVRGRIAAELAKRLPADADAPLTATGRAEIAAAFAAVAAVLEKVK